MSTIISNNINNSNNTNNNNNDNNDGEVVMITSTSSSSQQQHQTTRTITITTTTNTTPKRSNSGVRIQDVSVSSHTSGTGTSESKQVRYHNSNNQSINNTSHNNSLSSNANAITPGNSLHGSAIVQPSAKRLYRAGENKWVTRDIATLDFLLGIPLAAEQEIVSRGWQLELQKDDDNVTESSNDDDDSTRRREQVFAATAKGTWWEKWIQPSDNNNMINNGGSSSNKNNSNHNNTTTEAAMLERPTEADTSANKNKENSFVPLAYTPGRRLEGDDAIRIQIPLTIDTVTMQRSIARQAALREWEIKTAHGLSGTDPPLLDGRLFFSADSSYPMSVFSIIRYEPKKEEAAFRRRKLEAVGGGGSQFVVPTRDWRGVSYRALLRRSNDNDKDDDKAFNRFVRSNDIGKDNDDDDDDDNDLSSTSSSSTDSSDVYVPGLLDDPDMVLGRHRTVFVGDRVTGPIVSSTIHFVKPALLKAELNKQFRDRFDGWEPPKSARKYIGAKVIQGNYVLIDPTQEEYDEQSLINERRVAQRNRQNSVTSISTSSEGGGPSAEKTIRMPPSLTLSKIRSLKHQALQAAVHANLEISTVALACVYFERLCLDCRVDKSNRRLTFAACLLLSSKLNEPNVGLVMQREVESSSSSSKKNGGSDDMANRIQSLIRPNKRSNKMFASLLLFFTQDWGLSLKHLFSAEWGVFAALGFALHATPSQVAFHFKRLMKTLEWNILDYLGGEMYSHWQEVLADEDERRIKRERRKEARRQRKEERILNLHIEIENEVFRRKTERTASVASDEAVPQHPSSDDLVVVNKEKIVSTSATNTTKKERRIKLFNPFALRRSISQERLNDHNPNIPHHHHDQNDGTKKPHAMTLEDAVIDNSHIGVVTSRSSRVTTTGMPTSVSMPTLVDPGGGGNNSIDGMVAIDILTQPVTNDDKSGASSIASQDGSYTDGGIII